VTDDLCIHDLTPATCSLCLHGPTPRPEPAYPVTRAFAAKYDGTCRDCGCDFALGDPIVKMSDESYWHARCAL